MLRAVIIAKLVKLGISFILELPVMLVAKLVILGTLSSVFLVLVLHTSFLTTSFLLYHLVYLNQQEQVQMYQHLIYLLYFSNCLNYIVHFLVYQYLIYLHQISSLLNQLFNTF